MAAVLEPAGEISPALSFLALPVNNSREAIVENVRENMKRGLPHLKQAEATDIPVAVVGGGPSLHDYLPLLRSLVPGCHVLAVNGAYKFLRSVGIESDHFILIDSRRDNVTHVEAPHEHTNHYLASQVHPAVYDRLRDYKVTMFHLGTEATLEALRGQGEVSGLAGPVGMASVHAVYLAAALGYRKIWLFGYDFSHKAGETYAFEQRMNENDGVVPVEFNGKSYRTTVALAKTAEQFIRSISGLIQALDLDVRMFSDGLLPDIVRFNQQER